MDDSLSKYLESELFDYYKTKAYVESCKSDGLDPKDKQYRKAKQMLYDIERTFQLLEEDLQLFMKLYYFDRLPKKIVIGKCISISERTSRRWKNNIVKALANQCGYRR